MQKRKKHIFFFFFFWMLSLGVAIADHLHQVLEPYSLLLWLVGRLFKHRFPVCNTNSRSGNLLSGSRYYDSSKRVFSHSLRSTQHLGQSYTLQGHLLHTLSVSLACLSRCLSHELGSSLSVLGKLFTTSSNLLQNFSFSSIWKENDPSFYCLQ